MAALTTSRSTLQYGGVPTGCPCVQRFSLPVEAAKVLQQGALVAVNAAGNAIPAGSAAGTCVGRCEELADNTSGAAGAINAEIGQGTFMWDMAGTAFTKAQFNTVVFALDDHTVEYSTGSNVAGVFVGLDSATGTQAMVTTMIGGRIV